ncbi:hypothetical protein GDN83_06500 [Gordonia jinghuaiqii]|uniref:Uncharacterized protein n=2 Tax=Gordonia jinghuaiqii TaxID=2758710 RepID=A0A7D7R889_9ACTN|nr:hypothetical protein [Gordonia jinghuaiqii]QMT00030.1 hypothetical protein H1R19_13835 [Gordonia jinghuaiqii]
MRSTMSKNPALQRRDRPWVGSVLSLLLGPVDLPPLDDVRAALVRVAAENPHARLGWQLDRVAMRWVPGEPTDAMVTEGEPWPEGTDLGDVVDALVADADDQMPLQFVRFPNHLGMVVCHALSDGRSNGAIMEAVAAAASTGDYAPIASHPSGRMPMLSAAWATFGRDPKRFRAAFADRPDRSGPPTAGVMVPWQPSRKTLYASLDGALRDETVATVKATAGKVSNFAVVAIAVIRALQGAGVEVSPVSNVVVDLRTYLDGEWINGNFLGALPIRIDEDTTILEVSQRIRSGMRSARPLAGALLSSARTGSRRHRPTIPTSVDPTAPAVVAFSDVGMRTNIPFSDAGNPVYASSNEPDGPNGVTIVALHTKDASLLSVSFHDNVIDAGRVDAALKALTHDFRRLVFGEEAS